MQIQARIWSKQWLFCEKPFEVQVVVEYLGRYTHKITSKS
jgi:hypothetical protein